MYSAQRASVKLVVDLSFFDWVTGFAREFGCSLFSGVLSAGTLVLVEHLMVLWVAEVFNLRILGDWNVYCVPENLFGLANVTVNA